MGLKNGGWPACLSRCLVIAILPEREGLASFSLQSGRLFCEKSPQTPFPIKWSQRIFCLFEPAIRMARRPKPYPYPESELL